MRKHWFLSKLKNKDEVLKNLKVVAFFKFKALRRAYDDLE